MPSELGAMIEAMDYLMGWWQGRNPKAPPLLLLRDLDAELMRAHKVLVAELWAAVPQEVRDGNSGENA